MSKLRDKGGHPRRLKCVLMYSIERPLILIVVLGLTPLSKMTPRKSTEARYMQWEPVLRTL